MKKFISAALALLLLAPVCALSQEYSYGMDAKRDTAAFRSMRKRMAVIRKKRPTVALVLSGGGAKGAAHISVIKEIERRGMFTLGYRILMDGKKQKGVVVLV